MLQPSKKLTAYSAGGKTLCDNVPYIEVQWNRKLYEVGSFTVYMRLSDYDPDWRFFTLDGRSEWGLILKFEYEDKTEGEFVTLSGFFAEYVLKWNGTCTLTEQWQIPAFVGTVDFSYGNLNNLLAVMEYEKNNTDYLKMPHSTTEFVLFRGHKGIGAAEFENINAVYVMGESYYNLIYQSIINSGLGYTIRCTPVFTDGINGTYNETDRNTEGYWDYIDYAAYLGGVDNNIVFSKANGNIKNLHYSRDESGMLNGIRVYSVETAGLNEDNDLQTVQADFQRYYPYDNTLTADEQKQLQNQGWFHDFNRWQNNLPTADKIWLPNAQPRKIYDGGKPILYSSQTIEERVKSANNHPRCFPNLSKMGKRAIADKAIQAQTSNDKMPSTREAIFTEWTEQGNAEFRNCAAQNSITGTVVNIPNCVYGTDYDLGSPVKVNVQAESGVKQFTCRITEASEVHSQNHMTVQVNFANPTLNQRWKAPA